ncbi:MAG TPA: DUF3300 domain-containing protein [Alphaproteobacteria bacterium]
MGRRALCGWALPLLLLAACAEDPANITTTTTAARPAAASPFSGSQTTLTPDQLDTLVSPIALYPDDLVALVLPAATQPLQVIEAQRFLAQRKTNPSLQPPKSWDPSVVALLNYPEVLALLSTDPTWLQQLGTSVAYQQAGVMDAVQRLRRKAYETGALKSDDKQVVTVGPAGAGLQDVVIIEPANPQAVYVPAYHSTTVVYNSPYPYPYPYPWWGPYPYYYDPVAPFYVGLFFGTTIGFGCDWDDDEIYRGEVDRDELRRRVEERRNQRGEDRTARREERRNSETADQIRRNGENRWRANTGGLEQARATREGSRNIGSGDIGGRDLGGARDRALSSGAFSGVDRGAAASRASARGAGSLGGGGFRGGGGRGGRR